MNSNSQLKYRLSSGLYPKSPKKNFFNTVPIKHTLHYFLNDARLILKVKRIVNYVLLVVTFFTTSVLLQVHTVSVVCGLFYLHSEYCFLL